MKHLSREMIDRSPEIRAWLNQFADADRLAAVELLMRLTFCTRDMYAGWLSREVAALSQEPCALYAARRLPRNQINLWRPNGSMVHRTAAARGSEDFVMSIIAQLCRRDDAVYVDHPSIGTLRSRRIRNIVLLDDSVGSGERVASYLCRFFGAPSIRSWWSYGKLHLHVFALARSDEGERQIMDQIPGSDHPSRTFRKSSKVTFHGPYAYASTEARSRWGAAAERIISLCNRTKQIPQNRRKGYGGVMGNLVFYHSVPNNIPGVLFVSNARWRPLFPRRTFPAWLSNLLDHERAPTPVRRRREIVNETLLFALALIKKGLTRHGGLAYRLGISSSHLSQLLASGVKSGFLTPEFHLTKRGADLVIQNRRVVRATPFDRSLYIPQSWCAGQNAIQPLPPSQAEEGSNDATASDEETSE